MSTLLAEYKRFRIYGVGADVLEISIYKPDNTPWTRYLTFSVETGTRRAYELIDSDAGTAIIESMNVIKPHTFQIGDIVTIRETPTERKVTLALIESIEDDLYYVSPILHDKFYTKSPKRVPHQLEKLTMYANREKWVLIKKDLDRQTDGRIIQDWLDSL